MKTKLAQVFDELLREVAANPDLQARIERLLSPSRDKADSTAVKSKPKNRRGQPALDPYAEIQQGESLLRQKLVLLTVDQLKDIVSGYALDASRLALKWKDHERLVEFILATVRSRFEKGDAFRIDSDKPRAVA